MKFLMLVALLFGTQARASGCGGGGWTLISREKLAPTEIRANYFGEAVTEVSVYQKTTGFVILKNVGFEKERLQFYSGSFLLEKIDLVELLTKLKAMYPTFLAETVKTVETNPYYDDCNDIPENTSMTRMSYTFSVQMQNGESQNFRAETVSYDPPL